MGANNTRLSPRQKMINLMYIVLTAMLALNVSSDVLDGFTQVEEGLARTNVNVKERNDAILRQLQVVTATNEKAQPWLDKALEVRSATDEVYRMIDSLKLEIVRQADGPKGNLKEIYNRDDLEAASVVMLSPTNPKGTKLRKAVEGYRNYIISILDDPAKRANIGAMLSTSPVKRKGVVVPQSWEESKFDRQPVVAAVTLMTKLQNDIRYSEGEALQYLLGSVGREDGIVLPPEAAQYVENNNNFFVQDLKAFVVPESRIVMRGGKYSARIVVAAVDSTNKPAAIYVNGSRLSNNRGLYEVGAGSTGRHEFKGYIDVTRGDGTSQRLDFSSWYNVIEPTATVSNTMMSVIYAGIDNPIAISAPGIPMSDLSATMTNGTLTRNGDSWVARSSSVGSEATITVTANVNGHSTTLNTTTFRVRKLPDPTAYIAIGGNEYKGGKPLGKSALLGAGGVDAAIDDGILNIKFNVLSFETVSFDSMGNALVEVSSGSRFSARQQEQFKRMSHGKRFFITRIKASGPDGVTRDLSPIEVIVN